MHLYCREKIRFLVQLFRSHYAEEKDRVRMFASVYIQGLRPKELMNRYNRVSCGIVISGQWVLRYERGKKTERDKWRGAITRRLSIA